MKPIVLMKANIEDFSEIKEIYLAGINTGDATFAGADEVGNAEKWFAGKVRDSVLKAVSDETIFGWCALSPYKDTCAYSGVAEVSVYVSQAAQKKGIGSMLMNTLVDFAESRDIWTLQAGIFPENKGSIRLHQKHGFRIVGIREKIGKLGGIWRDVVLLERRSSRIF